MKAIDEKKLEAVRGGGEPEPIIFGTPPHP